MKRLMNIRQVMVLALCTVMNTVMYAQAKFEPKQGEKLLFIGQDMGAAGGFDAPNNKGYRDAIDAQPYGATTYTSMPSLAGLETTTNYGSGDLCGQCIVSSQNWKGSAIAIGFWLVGSLKPIGAGELDMQIEILADWIKESGRPVFLRVGYEFDGNWNNYDPTEYKVAYKRIVDKLREQNVENFVTVWQACTSPVDDKIEQKHENIGDWYPGDEYVDWCGLSWFLNNEKQVELSDELLDFAREHGKPVMVAESSPQGYDLKEKNKRNIGDLVDGPSGKDLKSKKSEEIWDEWFVPYFNYISKNEDVIKAVAYINCDWDSQPMWGEPYNQGYWGDTRIEVNNFIKKMWLKETSKPGWIHAGQAQ